MQQFYLEPVDWTPLTDEAYLDAHGNPVNFLHVMLGMMARRDYKEIAFDHKALEYMERMWSLAGMAAVGHKFRDKILREAERCRHWAKVLKDGMHERGESGFVFFDSPSDWPDRKTVVSAIRALQRAQIKVVH